MPKKVIHDYPEWDEIFRKPIQERKRMKQQYARDMWKAMQSRNRMFLAPNGQDYRMVEFMDTNNRCRMMFNGHRIYGYIVNNKFVPDRKAAA